MTSVQELPSLAKRDWFADILPYVSRSHLATPQAVHQRYNLAKEITIYSTAWLLLI